MHAGSIPAARSGDMSGNNGTSNGTRVRAYVVDDHPIVIDGVRLRAEQRPDVEIVGASDDVERALEEIDRTRPDILVTELSLPGAGGFGLIRALRSRTDRVRVVVLSGLEQGTYVQRALQAGAHAFVAKSSSPDELFEAIEAVHRGETFISTGLVDAAGLNAADAHEQRGREPLERLSNRELEVFRMIGEGRSTREIARVLERSIKTVEAHREHIKQKLGLRDGSALLQRAIQWVWEQQTPA